VDNTVGGDDSCSSLGFGILGKTMTGTTDFVVTIDAAYPSHLYLKVKNTGTSDIVKVEVKASAGGVDYFDGEPIRLDTNAAVSSDKPIRPGEEVQLKVSFDQTQPSVGTRLTVSIRCIFADGRVVVHGMPAIIQSL